MSPSSLAHVHGGTPSLSTVALELVERLVEQTDGAANDVATGDLDTLEGLLEARDAMIASLADISTLLAAGDESRGPRAAVTDTIRMELLAQANLLQRANVRLMQCVRGEAARVSASLAGLDRHDSIELAYRAAAERPGNLDLMR